MTESEYLQIEDHLGRKEKELIMKSLSPEQKDLFLEYLTDYWHSGPSLFEDKKGDYYVLGVYTVGDNKPFFYGISGNPERKYDRKTSAYDKFILENKGYYTQVVEGPISYFQARVMEKVLIRKAYKEGKFLVCCSAFGINWNKNALEEAMKQHAGSFVYKDNFFKYLFPDIFNVEEAFDSVDVEMLSNTFFFEKQDLTVSEWLIQANARVNKIISTGTKSVIVDRYIPYFDYKKIKSQGIKIYAIEDVLSTISSTTPVNFYKRSRPLKLPSFDKTKRNAIREYLSLHRTQINDFFIYHDHVEGPGLYQRYWDDPFLSPSLKFFKPGYKIKNDLIKLIKDEAIVRKNPRKHYYNDLIKDYSTLGLYEELYEILYATGWLYYDALKMKQLADLEND